MSANTGVRAVPRQPEEAGVCEGRGARGPAHARHQRLPRGGRIAVRRDVREGGIANAVPDAQRAAGRGADQGLDGMDGPRAEHLANAVGPEEGRRGHPWPRPAVPRLRPAGSQAEVAADDPGQPVWRRSRINRSALAVSPSATASLKARPAATRRWTSATHVAGIHSTRFVPSTMKVRDHSGWPAPWAQ
jgi:hypothetical protein